MSVAKRGLLEIELRPTWLDIVQLEMKLHKVYFAVKFSKAEAQPRLRNKGELA